MRRMSTVAKAPVKSTKGSTAEVIGDQAAEQQAGLHAWCAAEAVRNGELVTGQ